jgi:hypothetical protein
VGSRFELGKGPEAISEGLLSLRGLIVGVIDKPHFGVVYRTTPVASHRRSGLRVEPYRLGPNAKGLKKASQARLR